MSDGQLGVLHTEKRYVMSQPALPTRTEDSRMKMLDIQIKLLEDKENAFFNKFGYSDIKEFIKDLRRILQNNESDMRVLRRFSSNNLQRHLSKFKKANSNMFVNQNIRLILKGDEKRINQLFNAHGGNEGITWSIEAPNEVLLVNWDTRIIKDITNKLSGKTFQRGSTNTEKLVDFLRKDGFNYVEVQIGNQKQSIDEFIINNMVSPFELKPNEFKELIKKDSSIEKELRARIESFLYDDLCAGASNELRKVVKNIMETKFPLNKPETLAFFMGGEGWGTHSLGSFGELQTAIFFQYIALKTPNKFMATQITNIVGDELNSYKQQKHTDIELFESFGIQVKNYGGTTDFHTGEEKTVDVNLHPTEVAPLNTNGVVDYLVNSYFNTDIEKYSEDDLNTFFESYASELLNLDLTPQIPDQVVFYIVGGHIIPGSILLRQAFGKEEQTVRVHTIITGKEGKSSNEYLSPKVNDKWKGWDEPFHKWWKSTVLPPKIGEFEPTDDNNIGAWDRYISIRTSFTYKTFFNSADYSLFK